LSVSTSSGSDLVGEGDRQRGEEVVDLVGHDRAEDRSVIAPSLSVAAGGPARQSRARRAR
jgi:hypothetical protein